MGGAMLWAYFQARAKVQVENNTPPDVMFMVDLMFIPSLIFSNWLVTGFFISPLKKQLKKEREALRANS